MYRNILFITIIFILVQLILIIILWLNIMRRKNAETSLLQEKSLIAAMMDAITDHIYFKNTESQFIRINTALAEWFNLADPSEAIGKTDFDFFSKEHAQKAYQDEQQIIETGDPLINIEERETWPDGSVTYVSTTKFPLRDFRGKIMGTFGISRDITERIHIEQRIQRQNAALIRLAAHPPWKPGQLSEALHAITEAVTSTLEVQWVNIWKLAPDQRAIVNIDDFNRESGLHTTGRVFSLASAPHFFQVLMASQVVDAYDVRTDPRTQELIEESWIPRNIRASITAPIRLHGDVVGFICCDHVGTTRNWFADEVNFVSQMSNLIAQVLLKVDLHRQAEEMAAIIRVSHEITSLSNLQRIYLLIARHASELSRSDASAVFTIRPDGRLYIAFGYGVHQQFIDTLNVHGLLPGEGAMGRSILTCKPVQIVDVLAEPNQPYIEETIEEGIRSVLAVPMLRGKEVIGGVVLWHRSPRHFTPQEETFLQALAQECVNAVENARLLEAEARRRQEAETLRSAIQALSSSLELQKVLDLILTELQRVVPYDSASVQQLSSEYLEIIGGRGFANLEDLLGVRFDLHTSDNPNQIVMKTRQSLILDDAPQMYSEFHQEPHVKAQTRSWLGTPLLFGDRLIGMIALDKQESSFYTREHAQLAQAFAAQAAVAIENARLFESERAQLHLARTLQQVGALLTTRMSQEEVCERIFDLLAQVVKYDSVSIQLLDKGGGMELLAGRGFSDINVARRITRKISPRRFEDFQGKQYVFVLPDTHADPRWNKDLGHDYIRSWIGAALLVKDAFIGVLNVDSATVNAYNDALGQTVAAFANQAAIAIENARMFTELKHAEERLRTLNEELEQRVEARTLELQQANTALKESFATLQKTSEQLLLREKMSALGELVAGITHEINNPISVGVTAATHLEEKTCELMQHYQAGGMRRSDLENYINTASKSATMILENLQRVSEQIKSFKQVAVDQTSDQRRQFFLKPYLEDVFLSLHPALRKTSPHVSMSCPENIEIDSYPGVFAQIITNLVMNSLIHGFESKEHATILLTITEADETLQMIYQDNGKGILPQNVSKIFDPFYTTRREQGGSGLGLNIVHNLVTQKLHGTIECESIPEKETRFILRIPLK